MVNNYKKKTNLCIKLYKIFFYFFIFINFLYFIKNENEKNK